MNITSAVVFRGSSAVETKQIFDDLVATVVATVVSTMVATMEAATMVATRSSTASSFEAILIQKPVTTDCFCNDFWQAR